MHIDIHYVISEVIEPFSDPRDIFWCLELAKHEGKTLINLLYKCNNNSPLKIKLKVIPYTETVLDITLCIPNTAEFAKTSNLLLETKNMDTEVIFDKTSLCIYFKQNLRKALKYILKTIRELCSESGIEYACYVGDEQQNE